MNSTNKKKWIIIGIAITVILVIGVVAFFILRKGGNEEPLIENAIPQKSLPVTKQNVKVEIKEISSKIKNYPLYTINSDIQLQQVEKLVSDLGFTFGSKDREEVYYFWYRGKDAIYYDLSSNTLTISGKDILRVNDSSNISEETFSSLAKEYFGEEWEYGLFEQKKYPDGTYEYRASRKLGEDLYIQTRESLYETDMIRVQGGRITSAQLMLSNFSKTDEYVPLISRSLLEKYIADPKYPKEVFPDMSIVKGQLDLGDYSEVYTEMGRNLTDCISDKVDVIYYYKNIEQEFLTPVYKISARCDANYENKKYQVPVTMFTNAIDPSYILTD